MKVMMVNLLLLCLMTGFISADGALPPIEEGLFRIQEVNDAQGVKTTETTKQNLKDQMPQIDLRRQPVEAESKKLLPILACEQSQHRIVLLDANKKWRDESAELDRVSSLLFASKCNEARAF